MSYSVDYIRGIEAQLSSAIARAEAAEAKVRELEPKAAIHDTAVANGWKEQIAFQRAYAERSTLRQQAEGMAGALEFFAGQADPIIEFRLGDTTQATAVVAEPEHVRRAAEALSAFRASSRGGE